MSTGDHDDDTHHLVRDRAALTTQQKHEAIILTPPMVLAAALMYLMLADGEVGPTDSGPDGASSGIVSPLLKITHDYVHAVPFEQFLVDAPALLSVKERLGVLVNVCDAMLANATPHEAERLRFDQLTLAFGIKPEAFETFMQAVSVKNNRAVLGDFDGAKLEIHDPSAHLGLAAALVHSLMAPDGSVTEQDVDRLRGVIGQYQGLLQYALQQAPKVDPQHMFETLANALNGEQKLFVLTNVLDTMLKDGEVEAPEKKSIFQSMRSVLGFTENAFKPFVLALKIKGTKSAASHDQFGASIMRSMRAKFEKKPVGFGLKVMQEAGVGRSNVQQVTRFDTAAGVQALASAGTGGASFGTVARFTDEFSSDPSGASLALGFGQGTSQHGGVQRVEHRTASSADPVSGRSLRPGDGRHGSKRLSSRESSHHAQAQTKLGTVRKQLESTRAANAEIRARMDQPYVPGKKSARSGRPKAAASAARAPVPTASASQQQKAQAAAGLPSSTWPLGRAAVSGVRSAVAAIQVQQRTDMDGAVRKVSAGSNEQSVGTGKQEVLLGADFSDPGFLGRVAMPVVVLAALLLATGGGSGWGSLPARAAMRLPCWLGSSLIKPMHMPHAGIGCWSSPRLPAQSSAVFTGFGGLAGSQPKHAKAHAIGFAQNRRLTIPAN